MSGRFSSNHDFSMGRSVSRTTSSSVGSCFFAISVSLSNAEPTALANSVDFGASDSPEAIHLLAPGDEERYLFFPSVVGAVVPVVNLPGLTSDIAFTPEAVAGIYLGKVKKWNDPI